MIDSGSARNPNCTVSWSTCSHSNATLTCERASSGSDSIAPNITSDHTNAASMSPVAIQPALGSPRRLPKSSSTAAPISGSRGTMPTKERRSFAIRLVLILRAPLILREP